MSDEQIASTNGAGRFDLNNLLNMIVPYEFQFEGSILKGHWYKYKTTNPSYVRSVIARSRELREQILDLTVKIAAVTALDSQFAALLERRDALQDQFERLPFDWMAEAITEWNAVGIDNNVLPITKATLDTWPLVLLSNLNKFFAEQRSSANPT